MLQILPSRQIFAIFGAIAFFAANSCSKMSDAPSQSQPQTTFTVEEVKEHFANRGKTVLSFAGYSGLGYQDQDALKDIVINRYLKTLDKDKTIINIGATPDGVGAAYEWAVQEGFETTGIVSSQALEYGVEVSPFCKDGTFFLQDDSWGGYAEGGEQLSPTSEAMVSVSNIMVAIGGGEITLDEMREMQKRGKTVIYHSSEMNHEKARAKAEKNGDPAPESFLGPLEGNF